MRTSIAAVVLSMLTVFVMGCAASAAQREHASVRDARRDCSQAVKSCSPRLGSSLAQRDVVTWREYYTSVMDEAFRRNSAVIWINPPKPIGNVAVAQGALQPNIAPTGLGH